MTKRIGILHDFKLNGQFCVTFCEVKGDTETLSFACYPTKGKALIESGVFENYGIYKKLAKV